MTIASTSTKTKPTPSLLGMTLPEMERYLEQLGEPHYRARQIYNWVYARRVNNFDDMLNLPKPLRSRLAESLAVQPLSIAREQQGFDGSAKYLFELSDKRRVEGVLIPEGERLTACLSSQVGCIVGCKFCATGKLGFMRNMTAGEILAQLPLMEESFGKRVTNIVMMGMGEPLLNRNALFKAISLLIDPEGMAMSMRRLTVSTVGWLPGIRAMTSVGMKVKLAISLNGSTEKQRKEWLPLASKYPMPAVIKAGQQYSEQAGNRLGISYLMMNGINDSEADALRLKRLLTGVSCKVNLMEYNDTGVSNLRADPAKVEQFAHILRQPQLTVTVRTSRGGNIDAACGQLAGEYKY
ncbi:23S rRNA (adenine(2503)-C(2))-methyltransferase RlmN [Calditrichota bacterium]